MKILIISTFALLLGYSSFAQTTLLSNYPLQADITPQISNGQWRAFGFQTSGSVELISLTANLAHFTGSKELQAWIYTSDSSGMPVSVATKLITPSFSDPNYTFADRTFLPSSPFTFQEGSTYSLVFGVVDTGDTQYNWTTSLTAFSGSASPLQSYYSLNNGTTWAIEDAYPPGSISILASPVPEPAFLSFLGLAVWFFILKVEQGAAANP